MTFKGSLTKWTANWKDGKARCYTWQGEEFWFKQSLPPFPCTPLHTTATSQRKSSKLLIAPKETFFGMEDGQNNYAPVAWDQVVKPRKDGGLGIRCLHTQMSAIHAHNIWRFLQSPNAWWVRLFKQKYLRSSSFNECQVKSTDSKFWKTLIRNKNTILDNLRWVVGKDNQVDIFHDQWNCGYGSACKVPNKIRIRTIARHFCTK